MPHYFFHLAFGDRLVPDEEGVQLASRSQARSEAEAVIRELSDAQSGSNPPRWGGGVSCASGPRWACLRAGARPRAGGGGGAGGCPRAGASGPRPPPGRTPEGRALGRGPPPPPFFATPASPRSAPRNYSSPPAI